MVEAHRYAKRTRHLAGHRDVAGLAFGRPEPQVHNPAGSIIDGAEKTKLAVTAVTAVSSFQPIVRTGVCEKHLAFFVYTLSVPKHSSWSISLALSDTCFYEQPVERRTPHLNALLLGEE